MLIYRIENANHKGPYNEWAFSSVIVYASLDNEYVLEHVPAPYFDCPFNAADINEQYLFGFKSLRDLWHWWDIPVHRQSKQVWPSLRQDFYVAVYEAKKANVIQCKRQLAFRNGTFKAHLPFTSAYKARLNRSIKHAITSKA